MTHGPRSVVRVSAIIGAAALGLFAAFGMAGAASATTPSGPNIDPNAKGSVIIHKLVQPDTPSGLPNNGTQVDTTGLTPIEGVTFEIQKVGGIDLTTNAGWETTEGLTAADVIADPGQFPLGPGTSDVTDANGQITFGNLPVAVYLVTETDPGANPIASPAAPFLVSVPLPLNNDWLYNVHVYPKNSLANVTKTVDDSNAHGLGDQVQWTVSSLIPHLNQGGTLDNYTVTDTLDSRLGFDSATVSVQGLTLVPVQDFTVDATGQVVTVDFTSAGLAKLLTAQGQNVEVVYTTTVNSLGNGFIDNSALVNINDRDFHSNTVETKWGALVILKYTGDQSNKTPLSGAEFQVFTTLADAQNRTNPVAVNGVTTFVSGANGIAAVPGLKAANYFLVETKAPLGYTASTTPIPVTVVAGKVSLTDVDYNVQNSQTPPFSLPLTGGTGITLYLAGGAGLLILAAAITMITVRRRGTRTNASA